MHATLCTMSTAKTLRGTLCSFSPFHLLSISVLVPSSANRDARRFLLRSEIQAAPISVRSFSNAFIQRAVSKSVRSDRLVPASPVYTVDLYTATVRSHACEHAREPSLFGLMPAWYRSCSYWPPTTRRKRWKIWDTASRYAPLSFEFHGTRSSAAIGESVLHTCIWCST